MNVLPSCCPVPCLEVDLGVHEPVVLWEGNGAGMRREDTHLFPRVMQPPPPRKASPPIPITSDPNLPTQEGEKGNDEQYVVSGPTSRPLPMCVCWGERERCACGVPGEREPKIFLKEPRCEREEWPPEGAPVPNNTHSE